METDSAQAVLNMFPAHLPKLSVAFGIRKDVVTRLVSVANSHAVYVIGCDKILGMLCMHSALYASNK